MSQANRPNPSLLKWFAGLLLATFVVIALLAGALAVAGGGVPRLGRERVAVIEVSGLISADSAGGLLGAGGASAASIIAQVRETARDEAVRAVVVRVNSPGGAAAASQEIYEAILAARERKPYVCSMGDIAASGGYYLAAACDRIVANRATMTGSIGVIMSGYDLSGLLEWAQIDPLTIKSGQHKDLLGFARSLSADEKALLQTMVDDIFEQFLADVARGRNDSVERLRPYADGRVLTGSQAHAAHLIDELGGFWDAVAVAQELGGMPAEADPGIVTSRPPSLLGQLLGVRAPAAPRLLETPGVSPLMLVARLPELR